MLKTVEKAKKPEREGEHCTIINLFANEDKLINEGETTAIKLGIYIDKNTNNKKLFLWLGIIQGVGGLIYFKYFNLFIESFNNLFLVLHLNVSMQIQNMLIPLGISFFTFKSISYLT